MSFAESPDGRNELDEELFADAKGELLWHVLQLYPQLQTHFTNGRGRTGARRDLGKRIELNVNSENKGAPMAIKAPDETTYVLEATVILSDETTVEETDHTELVLFSVRQKKCLIPHEWLFKALELMDDESRAIIAEQLIAPKRSALLESDQRWSFQGDIDALNREYHHILGDQD